MSIARRDLLIGSSLAVVWGVIADTQANWPLLQSLSGPGPREREIEAVAADLFHLRSHHTSIVPAASNPAMRQRLLQFKRSPNVARHADLERYFSAATVDAACAIGSMLVGQSPDRTVDYEAARKLLKANTRAAVVAIGTPTSNELVRKLYQYRELEGSTSGHEHITDDAIHYPITFALLASDVVQHPIERDRFYRGRAMLGRTSALVPNWGLRFREREVVLPRTDGTGALLEDFLVLARVPNWLAPEAIERQAGVVCIGGTHSVGTMAIRHLLRDKSALPQLQQGLSALGRPPFWQAVIRVELAGPNGEVAKLTLERELVVAIETNPLKLLQRHG
jgi:hypothetical protein